MAGDNLAIYATMVGASVNDHNTDTHMHASLSGLCLEGRRMLCYYLVSHTHKQRKITETGTCHYLQSSTKDKKGKSSSKKNIEIDRHKEY